MQFIPHIPLSGISPPRYWRRVLVMLFAGILAVGMLQPATAHQGPNKIWVRDASVVEGDTGTTTAQVKIVLKRKHHFKKVSVAYKTVDGTAVAGSDYVAQSGRVWFPKGKKFAYVNVEVPVIGDTVDEADEYFKVHLFRPYRARIVDRVGIVTIVDDDEAAPPPPALPKLSVGDDSAEEGKAVWFKVSLSAPAPETVTFDYATANGTAEAGKDYDAASRNDKAIAKGEDHVWVQVMTREDDLDEPDEYFFLNISDVKGATVLDAQGKGTILDDDPTPAPKPTLTVHNDSVDEGGYAYFDITLSFKAPQDVTFDFATADDSAKAGETLDYKALTGNDVKIPKGSDSITIAVKTNQDTLDEINETFFLNVSDLKGALPGDLQGKATIVDDDAEPSLAIGSTTITQEGYHAVLKVDLSTASGKTVTVKWATADGTAVKVEDYKAASGTLTFVPGDLSEDITLETVAGPPLHEPLEVFYVNLSDPVNATINQFHKQGTVTIPAD